VLTKSCRFASSTTMLRAPKASGVRDLGASVLRSSATSSPGSARTAHSVSPAGSIAEA
jgi:hypothetical protein